MLTNSRLVQTIPFDTGPGTQNIPLLLDPIDISKGTALLLEMEVTKADTDAVDSMDVKFQDTTNLLTWNTRARFTAITGDQSPTVTAPEVLRLTLNQLVDLASTEEAYEPTGSAGATELAANSVLNGPFVPRFRGTHPTTGQKGTFSAHRFFLVITDADNDADFEGTLRVFAIEQI